MMRYVITILAILIIFNNPLLAQANAADTYRNIITPA